MHGMRTNKLYGIFISKMCFIYCLFFKYFFFLHFSLVHLLASNNGKEWSWSDVSLKWWMFIWLYMCVCVFVLLVHVHLNKLLLVWWLNVCVLLSEWYFRFFIWEKCIYKLNRDERRAREDGQYYSLNESHYFLFLLQCETHTHRK